MRDVEEIPKQLRKRLEFVPVRNMREVLDVALESVPEWRTPGVGEGKPSRSEHGSAPALLSPRKL
jgi:hypothetical protein